MSTTPWDGMSGLPSGPPEWPRPGGWFGQPSKLLEAVDLMRSELRYVRGGGKETKDVSKAARKRKR